MHRPHTKLSITRSALRSKLGAKLGMNVALYIHLSNELLFAPPTKLKLTPIRTNACLNKLHPSNQRKRLGSRAKGKTTVHSMKPGNKW